MKVFLFVVLALFFALANAQVPCIPPNGGAAVNVIGQASFLTNTAGAALNQLSSPYDITTDTTTFKIFIVDTGNNRVLRYPSAAAFLNGQAAEASFGGTAGCSATQLNFPTSITIQNDNCFISDFSNNRVVRLNACATVATGTAFTGVLGQTTFTTCTAISGLGGLNGPADVALDFAGSLYVTSYNEFLVKKYLTAATAVNGQAETVTFGTVNVTACGTNTFGTANGITIDPFTATAWISDDTCNRIVGYSSVSTQATGAPFTFVIGQASFTTGAAACAQNAFSSPQGIDYDGVTRALFVADFNNNRVLSYFNALSVLTAPLANTPASAVLGQTTFTACALAGAASASSLNKPIGVHYDAFEPAPYFNLFVADSNNSRVLRFECAASTSNTGSNSNSGSTSNSVSSSVSNSGSISTGAVPISNVTATSSNSNSGSVSVTRSGTVTWTGTSSHSNSGTVSGTVSWTPSVTPVFCGNGDLDNGEACDPGLGNFNGQSCCNPNCQFKNLNTKCGPRPGPCFIRPRCRYSSSTATTVTCQAAKAKKRGKFCKTTTITEGICDGQGTCISN